MAKPLYVLQLWSKQRRVNKKAIYVDLAVRIIIRCRMLSWSLPWDTPCLDFTELKKFLLAVLLSLSMQEIDSCSSCGLNVSWQPTNVELTKTTSSVNSSMIGFLCCRDCSRTGPSSAHFYASWKQAKTEMNKLWNLSWKVNAKVVARNLHIQQA